MTYHVAATLEEALHILRQGSGRARVLAGGTDLFLKGLPPEAVDIASLPELGAVEENGKYLLIGAGVTHAAAAASAMLRAEAGALPEACRQVGSPQVRNLGTLGGNVVNAAPAADAAVALVALGAKALLVDVDGGRRELPVENLYAGYNRSGVDSSREILTAFRVERRQPGESSSFLRFASRRALSLPILSAAARLKVEGGVIRQVRLVLAPVKPCPTRLLETEEMLLGLEAGLETWEKAAAAARREITVRSSLLRRCSGEYRRHLAGVLVTRVLAAAAAAAEREEH